MLLITPPTPLLVLSHINCVQKKKKNLLDLFTYIRINNILHIIIQVCFNILILNIHQTQQPLEIKAALLRHWARMVLVFNGMGADDERIRPRLKQLDLSFETHCSVTSCIQLLKLTYIWLPCNFLLPALVMIIKLY